MLSRSFFSASGPNALAPPALFPRGLTALEDGGLSRLAAFLAAGALALTFLPLDGAALDGATFSRFSSDF